jgi:hypothetical protein
MIQRFTLVPVSRLRVLLVLLVAACIAAAAGIANARAAAMICGTNSTPSSGTYAALVVPAGEECRLDGLAVTVTGNVIIRPGGYVFAGLTAPTELAIGGNVIVQAGGHFLFQTFCGAAGECGTSSLTIGRSIIGTNPAVISLDSGSIGRNVNIIGFTTDAFVTHATVGGNVLVIGGTGTELVVGFDSVSGQVIVAGNILPAGSVDIVEGNAIAGNLICSGNDPAPINQGVPNLVLRTSLGQCVGL